MIKHGVDTIPKWNYVKGNIYACEHKRIVLFRIVVAAFELKSKVTCSKET